MAKKSMLYLLGDLSVAFTQFAILILITKFYNISEVGIFTYSLAIIAPVSYLIQMQHRTVYVTGSFSQFNISEFLISRTILFLIFSSISYFFLITLDKGNEIFIAVFLWKFGEMLSDLIYGYWQKKNLIINISINKVIRSVIQLTVFVSSIFFNMSLILSLFNLALITILIFIFEFMKIEKTRVLSFNYKLFSQFVIFTFPLAMYSTLSILYINIPKYLIENMLNLSQLAIYSTISYFLVVGNLIINSLIQVRLTSLSRLFEINMKDFNKEIKKIIAFIFFIVFFAILFVYFFGEELLKIIYTEEISHNNYLLILLLIGSIFSYASIVIGVVLTIAKEYKIQPILSTLWCTFHIIISYVFIHFYGLSGAGYSFIVSSMFQFITSLYTLDRYVISKKNAT